MRVLTIEGSESQKEIENYYKQEKQLKRKRWLHILLLVFQGKNAVEIADLLKMSEEAIRRVVRKYNRDGLSALTPRTSPGRPRCLSSDQEEELKKIALSPPPPEEGIAIWTGLAFQQYILRKYNLECGLSTVYAILHRLGLSWLSPRPQNPKSQEKERRAFKKNGKNPEKISSGTSANAG